MILEDSENFQSEVFDFNGRTRIVSSVVIQDAITNKFFLVEQKEKTYLTRAKDKPSGWHLIASFRNESDLIKFLSDLNKDLRL